MGTNSEPRNEIIFAHLIERFHGTPHQEPEQRWLLLEAAHVVGQLHFSPHFRVHWLMLGMGWRTRLWPEVAGQVFRLALVPLGHLTGKLPLGNTGRSNISAFKALPVRSEVSKLICESRSIASQQCGPHLA